MTLNILDQAIITVASAQSKITPFNYMVQCYKRIGAAQGRLNSKSLNTVETYQLNVLKEVRRICVSYCEFTITNPDMFGYVWSQDFPPSRVLALTSLAA